jgi:hypothetical protein
MDRYLKIHAKKGYIFAEIHFSYALRKKVTATITQYSMYESEDSETGETTYNTYVFDTSDNPYVSFRQFKTMEELKQHDIDFAKKELRYKDMGNVADYTFTYGDEAQQARYFIGHDHINHKMGVADIQYNFEKNTKHLKFLSGQSLRWDFELDGDCLETNLDLIARVPIYDREGNMWELAYYDIATVDSW